jgi:hypothetical protein
VGHDRSEPFLANIVNHKSSNHPSPDNAGVARR